MKIRNLKKSRVRLALLIGLVSLFLLSGCAHMFTKGGGAFRDGDRAYNSKKYDEAVIYALKALEANPEFEDARALLDKAFKAGTSAYESTVTQKLATSEPFKYDLIWNAYYHLDKMHRAMGASPYSGEYNVKDYARALGEARETAAAERYEAGNAELSKGDFRSARRALIHYGKANNAVSGFQDVQAKIGEARKLAVANVVIAGSDGSQDLTSMMKFLGDKEEGFFRFEEAGAPMTLNSALSSYQGGYDFLIYITSERGGSVINPNTEKGPLLPGAKPTQNKTVGFETSFQSQAALYELAGGQQVATKSYSNSRKEEMTFSWLGWERKEKLNLTTYGGDLYYNITDFSADEFRASLSLISKAIYTVNNHSPEEITGYDDFMELKRDFNEAFVIRGAEILAYPAEDGTTSYRPVYTSEWDEHNLLSRNASRIYSTLEEHSVKLAEEATQSFSSEIVNSSQDFLAAFKGRM